MGFLDIFRPLKSNKQTRWKELGTFNARFVPFGRNMYNSDLVRSCIRPLVEHTSKANAVSSKPEIARLLNERPNLYMNGKDFLAKTRAYLEIKNTAFVYIERDVLGKVRGFYPVPYSGFEAMEYNGRLFVKFYFDGDAARDLTLPWEDLAVLRKDYLNSDIAGEDNSAIFNRLELINTTDQGIANAVKATANLRGILKSTKAMLSTKDIKAQKEQFVNDYLTLANEGGIASLDATQEFTPIHMEPAMASVETQQEFREDIYRYWGVNDNIVKSQFSEAQMEAFYDARIEPFLVALGLELTSKVFTQRERELKNYIIYESNRMQYASTQTKLNMVSLVDRGALTPNEWRAMFNLGPVEGGDVPIRRLDTAQVDEEGEQNDDKQRDTEED